MMIREIGPFKVDHCEDWAMKAGDCQFDICTRGLSKWFDVDRGKTALWVRIHDKPARDRLKVTGSMNVDTLFVEEATGYSVEVHVFGGWVRNPPAPYPYYVEIVQ